MNKGCIYRVLKRRLLKLLIAVILLLLFLFAYVFKSASEIEIEGDVFSPGPIAGAEL